MGVDPVPELPMADVEVKHSEMDPTRGNTSLQQEQQDATLAGVNPDPSFSPMNGVVASSAKNNNNNNDDDDQICKKEMGNPEPLDNHPVTDRLCPQSLVHPPTKENETATIPVPPPSNDNDGTVYFYPAGGAGNKKRKKQPFFRNLLRQYAMEYHDTEMDKREFVQQKIMIHFPNGAYYMETTTTTGAAASNSTHHAFVKANDEVVFKMISQKLRDIYNKEIKTKQPPPTLPSSVHYPVKKSYSQTMTTADAPNQTAKEGEEEDLDGTDGTLIPVWLIDMCLKNLSIQKWPHLILILVGGRVTFCAFVVGMVLVWIFLVVENVEAIKNQFWTYITAVRAENEKLLSIHAKQKEKIRLLEQLLAQKEEQEAAAEAQKASSSLRKPPKRRRRTQKQQVERLSMESTTKKERHVSSSRDESKEAEEDDTGGTVQPHVSV
jgi:hypothetical protein